MEALNETTILTTSGFREVDTNRETMADDIERISPLQYRFAIDVFAVTQTEGVRIEAKAQGQDVFNLSVSQSWSDLRILTAARHYTIDFGMASPGDPQELRDFWDAVSECLLPSPCNVNLHTSAFSTTSTSPPHRLPSKRRRPIWEIGAEIAASIPDEEAKKLPKDLSRNLDHYLYDVPKEEE